MRRLSLLAIAVCLLTAGCGSGPVTGTDTRTVTPAPLPETPTDVALLTPELATTLRPTCERGPRRVVEIGTTALRADNESAGIATLWAFTAPESRSLYGSYDEFANATRRGNGELLNATELSFGPITRFGDGALRVVEARQPDGSVVAFDVVVERQRGGRYEGCWMTTLVSRQRDRQAGPPRDG